MGLLTKNPSVCFLDTKILNSKFKKQCHTIQIKYNDIEQIDLNNRLLELRLLPT